jgi:hypothetical protein
MVQGDSPELRLKPGELPLVWRQQRPIVVGDRQYARGQIPQALAYSAGGSATTITFDPSSLATSSTFIAGRESTQIDNTSNLYLDAQLYVFMTVGTTPTANTVINLYLWGSYVSLGTTALDVLDGTDSAETFTSAGVLQSVCALGGQALVDAATSNITYAIRVRSVALALGQLVLPRFWGIYGAHNTAVNLHATAGNHVAKYDGVTF